MRESLVDGAVVAFHPFTVLAREPFRHRAVTAGVAVGDIAGFDTPGKLLGVRAALAHCTEHRARSGSEVGPVTEERNR
jgi:3-dehydroquinate dehydratase